MNHLKKKQLSLKFNYEFSRVGVSTESFLESVNDFATLDNTVRVIPFGCPNEWVDWSEFKWDDSRRITSISVEDRISSYRISYSKVVRKEEGDEEEYIYLTNEAVFYVVRHSDYSNVGMVVYIGSSEVFHRGLMFAINKLHPRLFLTFISHKRLKALVNDFREQWQFADIIVSKSVQRLRREITPKMNNSIPVIAWPRMKYDEAMEWIDNLNGWFASLELEAKQPAMECRVSISRSGVLRINGCFSEIMKSFAEPLQEIISENIKLFSGRARLERDNFTPSALQIIFPSEQFEEVEENKKFIEAMASFQSASVSVLHGNPYIHLSILDYLDASAFEVWVLDNDRVIIVPQLRASVAAIKRLVNHIFDRYAEGSLSDYKESMLE